MGNPKITNHVRSTSLPTATHPLISIAEEHLQRLKSSEGASTSSHSIICQRLDGLRRSYECVDDVLQLPHSQEILSHEKHAKWLEQVSDRSMKVLDTCNIIKDAFSQMKESVQLLESSLRRKVRESSLSDEVDASLISLVEGVEEISLQVLESTLAFISHPNQRSRTSGWSLVSTLLKSKKVSCEGADISEVEKINMELLLLRTKQTDHSQMRNVLKRLEIFESNIHELEDGLGAIFRHFVKTRVSLLNLLNH